MSYRTHTKASRRPFVPVELPIQLGATQFLPHPDPNCHANLRT